jgi:hypothetical protein
MLEDEQQLLLEMAAFCTQNLGFVANSSASLLLQGSCLRCLSEQAQHSALPL